MTFHYEFATMDGQVFQIPVHDSPPYPHGYREQFTDDEWHAVHDDECCPFCHQPIDAEQRCTSADCFLCLWPVPIPEWQPKRPPPPPPPNSGAGPRPLRPPRTGGSV